MNINPQIVDEQGREQFHVGGNTAWKTTRSRGYNVSLEWFVGAKSTEPILILWAERGGIDAGVLGICLSSIGAYADPSGQAAPGAVARCWEALPMLGKAHLQIEAHTLLDVILQFAPALITMPPAPMAVRREETGEALLEVELIDRDSGKTQQEVSI